MSSSKTPSPEIIDNVQTMGNLNDFSPLIEPLTHLWSNLEHILFDMNLLVQFVIIISALIFGVAFRSLTRPALIERINRMNMNFRGIRVLHNISKLIAPCVAYVIIFLATQLQYIDALNIDMRVVEASGKLVLAWIFIRLIAQVIENTILRQIIAMAAWLIAALSIVGLFEDATHALDSVGLMMGQFRFSLLTLFKILAVFAALVYLSLLLNKFLEKKLKTTGNISPSAQVLLVKISKALLMVAAFVIALTSAGIDLSILAVFSGAVGLGIGFGLQRGAGNLFSGFMILFDRSIKPGDVIELENGTFGWVNTIAGRYVSILARDGKEYLIPNEELVTKRVVNWSYSNTLVRLEVGFGVHYNSDPHQVKRIAEAAAMAPERVVQDRPALCHLTEFGDSSLNFKLRFWIRDPQNGVTNIKGEVMLALWDAFKENGIRIPYPHREMFVHQVEPAQTPPKKKTTRKKA